MVRNQSGRSSRQKVSGWTTIDTVILLLAVVVVIGVAARAVDFLWPDTRTSSQYHVSFTATEYYTVADQIGEQDDLYLCDTDTRLGYIRSEDMQSGRPNAEHNVVITGFFVVDEGQMTDEGILTIDKSDVSLSVGEDVSVCTDRVVLRIHIESIEEYVAESDTDMTEEDVTTEVDGETLPDVTPDEEEDITPPDESIESAESGTEVEESTGGDESDELRQEADSASDTDPTL